jgi:hypothetical protein
MVVKSLYMSNMFHGHKGVAMPINESILKPFVGGEVEMQTDGRPDWRCEVTKFLQNNYWIVAHVAWLVVNRGDRDTERWEKFQHPEFIVHLSNYHQPALEVYGKEQILLLRHRSMDRVIVFHLPEGERLDPAIVAPIRATFIPHGDPTRNM